MIRLMGAATITHQILPAAAVVIGTTYGGASINILKTILNPLSSFNKIEEKVYGVEGTIELFKLTGTHEISSDNILFDYGIIKFVVFSGSLTLFNAKIFLPDSFTLGQNSQNAITVKISGGANSAGKVYQIN